MSCRVEGALASAGGVSESVLLSGGKGASAPILFYIYNKFRGVWVGRLMLPSGY